MGPSPRVVTNAFPVVGRLGHPLVLGVHLCAPCWPRSRPRGKRACVERDGPASIPQVLSWRGCLWFPQGILTRCLWLYSRPIGPAGLSVHSVWVGGTCAANFGGQAGPAELSCTGCLACPCLSPWVPDPSRGRTLFRQLSLPSPTALGVREFSEY